MKAQEIIIEMEKLPPEERQAVMQHFEREKQEEYSKEVIAELLKRKKDAELGINMNKKFRKIPDIQNE